MERETIRIGTPTIQLDALLKFTGVVGTGGEAKHLIQSGCVHVNGEPELRRSHALGPGDFVDLFDETGAVIGSFAVARADADA
jgi:ribosome-associated protein